MNTTQKAIMSVTAIIIFIILGVTLYNDDFSAIAQSNGTWEQQTNHKVTTTKINIEDKTVIVSVKDSEGTTVSLPAKIDRKDKEIIVDFGKGTTGRWKYNIVNKTMYVSTKNALVGEKIELVKEEQ